MDRLSFSAQTKKSSPKGLLFHLMVCVSHEATPHTLPRVLGVKGLGDKYNLVCYPYSLFFSNHSKRRWSGRCLILKPSKVALKPLPSGQAAIMPTITGVLSSSQQLRIIV